MLLNVTTTAACKANCVYCPQDRFRSAMAERPSYLSRYEFADLLPQLADTRFDAISFGGFSEPFEDPDIVELLAMAAEHDGFGGVCIYSNGESMTPDVVAALRQVPLARVDISCHGFDAETYRRARPFLDADKVRDNVLFLLQNRSNIDELVISVTGPFGSAEALAELAALCERFDARFEHRTLHSRAGLLRIGRTPAPATPGAFRCAKFDFGKPTLVPGGDVALCCQDFGLESIIGNLHRESFGDMLANSPLRRHVLEVAAGREVDASLRCYQCAFCVPAAGAAA